MKQRNVLILSLALLGVIVLGGLWLGARRVEVVHYVLPENYRGYFWLIVDDNGERVVVKNGTATVVVPPNGIVRVKDDWFLKDWHRQSAAYTSGTQISTGTDDATSNGLKLWGLDFTTDGKLSAYSFLVGMAADHQKHFGRGNAMSSFDELLKRLGPSTRPTETVEPK